MSLRPPNAAESYEEQLQVYNLDLEDLTPSQLSNEIHRASLIAAHDPRAFIWRGRTPISARQWADERVRRCLELLSPVSPTAAHLRKRRAKPWMA